MSRLSPLTKHIRFAFNLASVAGANLLNPTKKHHQQTSTIRKPIVSDSLAHKYTVQQTDIAMKVDGNYALTDDLLFQHGNSMKES